MGAGLRVGWCDEGGSYDHRGFSDWSREGQGWGLGFVMVFFNDTLLDDEMTTLLL